MDRVYDRLLGGGSLSHDQVFWLLLLIGTFCASVHLVTMLATRWGDRRTTGKALIFSVLLHLSCAFGLVTIDPIPVRVIERQERDEPIQLNQVIVDGEVEHELEETGNVPAWEKLPEPEPDELKRLPRVAQEPEPTAPLERASEPVAAAEFTPVDLPSNQQEPVEAPKPESLGDQGPLAESAVSPEIDAVDPESRPDVEVSATMRRQAPLARTGQLDSDVRRQPAEGSVDRFHPDYDLSREFASLDEPTEVGGTIQRGPEAEDIVRRSGPAPSPVPQPETGATASESGDDVPSGRPELSRLAQRERQAGEQQESGVLERTQPEADPSHYAPSEQRELIVRDTIPAEVDREGLEPNVVRPDVPNIDPQSPVSLPPTYQLRDPAHRPEIARQFGGTEESERAVEASLKWLADNQHRDGYWDANRFGGGQIEVDDEGLDSRGARVREAAPGLQADSGLTGLAVLAFLGAGYTPEEGQYAANVERALGWIIRQQDEEGYLGGEATYFARMYCHAMATFALAEAYAMQSDSTQDSGLREPLQRAVAYILDQQNPRDGGWRYRKGQSGDMSMFGWQLMALKSAELGGIEIPRLAKARMIQFLKDRSMGDDEGLAAYRLTDPPMPVSASMTAEALFCKQMLGMQRDNPAGLEAVNYLLERLPRRSQTNMYYWYYGTLSMYQFGGDSWRQWNETLRDLLVSTQRTGGEYAGSWDPVGPWGPYGGRIYSTAICTLCLEVYYRFLPLYRMGGRYDAP